MRQCPGLRGGFAAAGRGHVQAVAFGFKISEVTCPTLYFEDASSINFSRSVKYGFGVLGAALELRLKRLGLRDPKFLRADGQRLPTDGKR